MRNARAILVLFVFISVTLPLMIVQSALLVLAPSGAAALPVHYHRFVCRLLDLRITVQGTRDSRRPLLLVSNHVSWLDIPVLSTLGPLSFVAKSEVRAWPLVGWLARLQRTVFVDRSRRARTPDTAREMESRLAKGDPLVLFAEGTSGDGNRILDFHSPLFSVAGFDTHIQPMAITYVAVNGLPMGRQHRPLAAWYGDMELIPHLWRFLRSGPVDVVVAIGDPISSEVGGDRKELARMAHREISTLFSQIISGARSK